MSHVHAGDDESFVTSVTHPDDGDNADAASVNAALEPANDGLAYLAARLLTWQMSGWSTGSTGQKVNITSTHVNAASRWAQLIDSGTFPIGWLQTDVTSVGALAFEIIPPHAMARLQRVEVRLNGGHGAGHGANKPATSASVLVSKGEGDGTYATLDTGDDSAITVGQYDVPHSIVLTSLDNDPLTPGETLWVIVRGEAGANSVASTLALYDVTCTWTSEDHP